MKRLTALALAALLSLGAAPALDPNSLTVTGDTGRGVTLSLADIAALPHETAQGATGHDGTTKPYEGARLVDVLRQVGAPLGARLHGAPVMDVLIATGADGYRAVFSLAEMDPGTHPPAKVIVADRSGGVPLGAKEGPLRLVIEGDARPTRSVHNLARLEIKRLP